MLFSHPTALMLRFLLLPSHALPVLRILVSEVISSVGEIHFLDISSQSFSRTTLSADT